MRLKFLIFLSLFLFTKLMYPQFYDTTLVLNSKLNVISQIDSRQENPANSIVGFPINEYFLQSNFIYRITVKGEVLLNSAGDRCPGPCILIAGSIFYGLEAAEPMTFILSPDDTIEYIPERVENLYLGAYIFDPDTIGDRLRSWAGLILEKMNLDLISHLRSLRIIRIRLIPVQS